MVEDKGKEADMGKEPKKGEKDNTMVELKERVDDKEVNKAGGQSPIKALDEEEIREDMHATLLGVSTFAELANAADAIVKDTVEKALKYTQVDEEVNS